VNILTKKITLTSHDGRSFEAPFNRLRWNEGKRKWELRAEQERS
jgi:hypothetical protein